MAANEVGHDKRAIREYVLAESPRGEVVHHAERIATRNLYGQVHEVWDVRTSRGRRWWVITEPTNLYSQSSALISRMRSM